MSEMNRREFVEKAVVLTGAVAVGSAAMAEEPKKPLPKITEKVKLGKTGITTSLVGIGTGSVGWNHQSNQTRLGQAKFNDLIRAAYDSGITFFDLADTYGSMPYFKEAMKAVLKDIPRDKIVIQSKIIHRTAEEARADLERFRKELGTDYIDTVLMHVVTEPDWNKRYQGVKDVLEEARQKGIIRAHGCSCHSFEALEAAANDPWVQVDLARFNPWGKYMDVRKGETEAQTPAAVKPVLQKMRAAGKGVIGMKILAQGDMLKAEDKLAKARESIKHALVAEAVDMMVIGFESPQQISEIMNETRVAMAEINAYRV
jgi:1-deoxyxylulose-5-phosphate synthase